MPPATRPFPEPAAIQQILDRRVAEKRTFGAVLATIDAAGTVETFAAGSSDNPTLRLDRTTVFELGSVTKTFTAALLAAMAAAGEVGLDDPVATLLPATVNVPQRGGRQITLLDLATHTSGLPRLPSNLRPASMANPYADYDVERMYRFLSGYTLERDIGSRYEYSNLGGGLLGHALALRAGTSYEALLTDRILRPLGMGETGIRLKPALVRRLAIGHDEQGRPVGTWDFPALAGTGALRSTLGDMVKYLAANLDPAAGPLGAVLATTHQSRRPVDGTEMTIGLAWHVMPAPRGTLVWHNGGTGGYRSFIGFAPDARIGLVLLTNSAIDPDDIAFHLLDPGLPLAPAPVARSEIAIEPAALERYAGAYRLTPDITITVRLEDGVLMAQATAQGAFRLRPESATVFFTDLADVLITFQTGAGGTVTGLGLRKDGRDFTAPRLT